MVYMYTRTQHMDVIPYNQKYEYTLQIGGPHESHRQPSNVAALLQALVECINLLLKNVKTKIISA